MKYTSSKNTSTSTRKTTAFQKKSMNLLMITGTFSEASPWTLLTRRWWPSRRRTASGSARSPFVGRRKSATTSKRRRMWPGWILRVPMRLKSPRIMISCLGILLRDRCRSLRVMWWVGRNLSSMRWVSRRVRMREKWITLIFSSNNSKPKTTKNSKRKRKFSKTMKNQSYGRQSMSKTYRKKMKNQLKARKTRKKKSSRLRNLYRRKTKRKRTRNRMSWSITCSRLLGWRRTLLYRLLLRRCQCSRSSRRWLWRSQLRV